MGIIPVLLFILLALTGVILLQIYLSKMESKWPGLVLPIISLCASVIVIFGIIGYTAITTTPQVMDENGVVIQESTPETTAPPVQSTGSLIFTVGYVFLLCNIPTAILLAIYFGCRKKQSQRKALEKMQAQDLE